MADIDSYNLKEAVIKIIGVGGAGGNTVNNIVSYLEKNSTIITLDQKRIFRNVDVIAANTDIQVLRKNRASIKIPLGEKITKGLGAGGNPEIGEKACIESIEDIRAVIKGADLLIITGGMGGGTGTGAIPVIAEEAKKEKILVIAVVTKPFKNEGDYKTILAEKGISKLKNNVDALVIIPNDRLLNLSPDLTNKDAYKEVDNVLIEAITGITDIITTEGMVNVDFADIASILRESGTAVVGIGKGKGERRHMDAIKKAMSFPLIEDADIHNSKGLIVYFKSSDNFKIKEQNEVMDYIQKKVSNRNVKLKYGQHFDNTIPEDELYITLIAAGFGFPEENKKIRPVVVEKNSEVDGEYIDVKEEDQENNRIKPAYLRRKVSLLD